MTLTTQTKPKAEPISAADLRDRARIIGTVSDAQLKPMIAAARGKVESLTRRRLITQTVTLTLDDLPCEIVVPTGPVQSVAAFKYDDTAGVEQTLDPADYKLLPGDSLNSIVPTYGTTWPTVRRDRAAVRIDVVVGYGPAGDDVPPQLVQAIFMLAALYWEFREAVAMGESVEVPFGVTDLCNDYRVYF